MESKDVWNRLYDLNKETDRLNSEIFSYRWELKCMDMDNELLERIITGAYKEWKRRNKNE